MSTDDRLTMALYSAEQDAARRKRLFHDDMQHVYRKAMECSLYHANNNGVSSFCARCLQELHDVIIARDSLHPAPFVTLTEVETCALLRQLHRATISHEGRSGPILHDLHHRLVTQIGGARYAEFVDGGFPDRLKPPKH